MKLKLNIPKEGKHQALVSAVGWSAADEVVSAGDDGKILRWNLYSGECQTLLKLPDDVYPTDLDFLPVVSTGGMAMGGGGIRKAAGSEMFALAAADGRIHLITRSGRVEKSIEAHQGAVTLVRWNSDASTVLSAGEDGAVRIWSRGGMLRSTVVQNSLSIYTACWSPDSDQVLCAVDRSLIIRSLLGGSKPSQWKAHEGVVLSVDWHAATGLIISGGEDRQYKIWDSFGRSLFASSILPSPVTSISWNGDGSVFAVGSFNMLRLCDRAGWSHSLDKLSGTGNLLAIRWSPDGTQLAAACGNGQVITATAIDRTLEWRHIEVSITDAKLAVVKDVLTGAVDRLEVRDRIIHASVGFNHLILITSAQCCIYSNRNWNTPIIFEPKEGNVSLIVQADRLFCLADGSGLYIYSYDGRLVSSPRLPAGTRTDLLSRQLLSLSPTTVAMRDRADKKIIHLFEAQNGKPVGDGKPFTHSVEVIALGLDQCSNPTEQRIAFIDRNGELNLASVRIFGTQARRVFKLSGVTSSLCWHDEVPMLATLAEGRFVVWCYPNCALADRELLPKTCLTIDASIYGRDPTLLAFTGNRLSVRRIDGAVVVVPIDPYPLQLQVAVAANKWEDAVRLCRFAKNDILWSCLAAMASYAKNLPAAEVAYAAIDKADRVQHLIHIRQLPSKELRAAELALFCGNIMEAESILLQAGLNFRALMMNIELYHWDRALDLGVKYRNYLDIVLAYRAKYLENFGREENNKKYFQITESNNELVEAARDWEQIQAKVEAELKREHGGGGGGAMTASHAPSGNR